MTSRYNSYAAKIYAEHPIGLWALDDNTVLAEEQVVSNIGNLGSISVVEADGHTGSTPKGYYVNPDELSRNTSVPLVFGAYNSTTIYDGSAGVYDSEDLPSLIIPSQGFLLERGRYYTLTVEFWANISNRSSIPTRIFGPIGSSDGLYVEGPFIGLKIDKSYKSHYVGTWGRPMLIQISIIRNLASVIINGATVISMSIDTESISLSPDQLQNGNSLDWLGFYATADTSPTQIDCVAIYAYMVTDGIAKQRFVYGQGTQSVDTIFNSFTATPVSIDYSFSNFGRNRTYPDLFRWENGDIENLETDLGRLSPPNYSLPAIAITGKTVQEWKNLQFAVDRDYFKINNTDGQNSYSGYLVFNNLNITKDPIRGFYGVFDAPTTITDKQILFRVENQQSGKYFEILLSSSAGNKYIEYRLDDVLLHSELLMEELYAPDKFSVGIDLNNSLKGQTFNQINDLFIDTAGSKIFIGGYPTLTNDRSNFYGKVYSVGFYTSENYKKLSTIVDNPISEEGNFEQDSWPDLEDYIASYTLIPKNSFDFFELDIAISGYWENSMSLSSLSKIMSDGSRELDYFQLNIDYPESEVLESYGVYEESLYKDTSQQIMRSYVIFRENEGISDEISWGDENDIYNLPQENVIITTEANIDKKLEVCDGTIVYAPEIAEASFLDYSVVVRLEFEIDGILSKPIKVRSLEIASRSLESSESVSKNPIGTKFGKQIFSYVKDGVERDYKDFNPLSISKSRSNYLYLTKNTGISLAGIYDENRKISFEVNKEQSAFYQVATLQFAMNYSYNNFEVSELAGEDVLLFEIIGSGQSHYKIYADFSSIYASKIGELYAVQVSGGVETDSPETKIFLNGIEPVSPIIKPGEWYFVGLQFEEPADFNGVSGEVVLSGPARFDNISLYLVSELEVNEKIVFVFWSVIDGTSETPETWNSYYNDLTWNEIFLGAGAFSPGVTPFSVYNTYVGSNSIIADSYSVNAIPSDIIFRFKDYEYRVKTDINFEQKVATPL